MSDTTATVGNKDQAMSKEDIAYFIRTMWESLLKPTWERGDLIDLGMSIFTKTTLAKMDQKKLGKLLPNLSIVAEHFGNLVRAKYMAEFDLFLQAQAKTQTSPPEPTPVSNELPPAVEQPATEPSGETNG